MPFFLQMSLAVIVSVQVTIERYTWKSYTIDLTQLQHLSKKGYIAPTIKEERKNTIHNLYLTSLF